MRKRDGFLGVSSAGFLLLMAATPVPGHVASATERTVEVVEVQRENLKESVTLVGSIQAYQQADIVPRVSGYLETLEVEEGMVLDAGAVVGKISVPERQADLAAAEAHIREAAAMVQDAVARVATAEEAVGVARAKVAAAEAEVQICAAEIGLLLVLAGRREQLYEKRATTLEEVEDARSKWQMAEARGLRAAASVRSAEANVTAAEAGREAARAAVLSRQAMEESAAAKRERILTDLRFATLVNPYPEGLIARRMMFAGSYVEAGKSRVVTVMDVSRLRVRLDIPERDLHRVARNSAATVVLDADSSHVIEAPITHYSGALDPMTRTLPVEIVLENPGPGVLPGMWCKVTLQASEKEGAMTLPAAAVRFEGRRAYVLVVKSGKVARADIELGYDNGIRTEITQGLDGSEQVILGNASGLQIGDAVVAKVGS